MPADRRLLGLAALAALTGALLTSARADAFCRTTTYPVPADHGGAECWTQGVALYHPATSLSYRLLTKESSVIPNAVLSAKLSAAWRS